MALYHIYLKIKTMYIFYVTANFTKYKCNNFGFRTYIKSYIYKFVFVFYDYYTYMLKLLSLNLKVYYNVTY